MIAGLRERVEEDVGRASKGEIEVVLREQWDARDRVSTSHHVRKRERGRERERSAMGDSL